MSIVGARRIAEGATKASRTQTFKLDAHFVDQAIDALRAGEVR
jgi:hypothetical protein